MTDTAWTEERAARLADALRFGGNCWAEIAGDTEEFTAILRAALAEIVALEAEKARSEKALMEISKLAPEGCVNASYRVGRIARQALAAPPAEPAHGAQDKEPAERLAVPSPMPIRFSPMSPRC